MVRTPSSVRTALPGRAPADSIEYIGCEGEFAEWERGEEAAGCVDNANCVQADFAAPAATLAPFAVTMVCPGSSSLCYCTFQLEFMPAAAAVVDRSSALEFLFGRINYERTVHIPYRTGGLKLDRMQQLLGLLGDPHVS